jgi:hypothetical protein
MNYDYMIYRIIGLMAASKTSLSDEMKLKLLTNYPVPSEDYKGFFGVAQGQHKNMTPHMRFEYNKKQNFDRLLQIDFNRNPQRNWLFDDPNVLAWSHTDNGFFCLTCVVFRPTSVGTSKIPPGRFVTGTGANN